MEKVAREAVTIIGDTQNLAAHGPGQPAPEQDLQRQPSASAILCLIVLCAWKLVRRGCAPVSSQWLRWGWAPDTSSGSFSIFFKDACLVSLLQGSVTGVSATLKKTKNKKTQLQIVALQPQWSFFLRPVGKSYTMPWIWIHHLQLVISHSLSELNRYMQRSRSRLCLWILR